MHENAILKRTSVNTSKGLRQVCLFHRYFYNLETITTVFTGIDAAAFISFFAIQLRRLFEGGV